MLTEELLKEILPNKTVNCCIIKDNMVWFRKAEPMVEVDTDYRINIYEFMGLCKEWAWSLDYCVDSFKTQGYDTWMVELSYPYDEDTFEIMDSFSTEYDAVFKACTRIMENKTSI